MEKILPHSYLTESGLVTSKSALVYYVSIRASATGAGIVTVYNGENTIDPVLSTISTVASTMADFSPPKPILADRGIYITLGANIASVFIQFDNL